MADRSLLRRFLFLSSTVDAVAILSGPKKALSSNERRRPYGSSSASVKEISDTEKEVKWFTLPSYTPTFVDGAALGKTISRNQPETVVSTVTALKRVARCCPELPRSLVQKPFRLRQASAKDLMNPGDRIFLPVTVEKLPSAKAECSISSEEEMEFLHSLVLYIRIQLSLL